MTKTKHEAGLEAAATKHYRMTGMTLSNESMGHIIQAYLSATATPDK
jgi:hypothetical protein